MFMNANSPAACYLAIDEFLNDTPCYGDILDISFFLMNGNFSIIQPYLSNPKAT